MLPTFLTEHQSAVGTPACASSGWRIKSLALGSPPPPAPASCDASGQEAQAGAAAGKRPAQAGGTPNKGGARKDAPATRERDASRSSEGSSAAHAHFFPLLQVEAAETAAMADEAIEVITAIHK